ncbi:hypothetical protein V6K52_14890 [Knoellia sp. S7-12]|uniref:hypothetical protein n=1 Tax=Knoellia sp. S7-12 TaxID=3126698 RepID=UPI0033660E85
MMGDRGRGWLGVLLSVVVLGVGSLLSNITTGAQLSGEDQALFAARRTASLLLNAGTLWVGVSVLAGWLVRLPVTAAVAGPLAGVGALVVHYGLGELTGLMPPGSFASNEFWFVAAALTVPRRASWVLRRERTPGGDCWPGSSSRWAPSSNRGWWAGGSRRHSRAKPSERRTSSLPSSSLSPAWRVPGSPS